MSAITSCGILFFYSKREISKKQMKVRLVLHYTYINVIVLGVAILCHWIDPTNLVQVVSMIFLVAAVYISVNLAMFNHEKRTADHINQRLRSKYPDEKKEE
jgi:membrane-associated HD superfamily phosphohydrolase